MTSPNRLPAPWKRDLERELGLSRGFISSVVRAGRGPDSPEAFRKWLVWWDALKKQRRKASRQRRRLADALKYLRNREAIRAQQRAYAATPQAKALRAARSGRSTTTT